LNGIRLSPILNSNINSYFKFMDEYPGCNTRDVYQWAFDLAVRSGKRELEAFVAKVPEPRFQTAAKAHLARANADEAKRRKGGKEYDSCRDLYDQAKTKLGLRTPDYPGATTLFGDAARCFERQPAASGNSSPGR
jgi:hypothetical protein